MITITKGNAILQLPCGCNTRKFKVREKDEEGFDEDMAELEEFLYDHHEDCWSK